MQAMQASDGLVRAWRVLAAEMGADNRWTDITPDWTVLAAQKRPPFMVIRINGQLNDLQETASIARIAALINRWQQAGVSIAGVEIDHDCATARLPAYVHFLTALRKQLPPATPLSITALPTWLESPVLDSLLAVPDEAVLQVHAVLNPRQGLFDAKLAQGWLTAFAEHTNHPWRVALPTYGTRVAWDANGNIADIESERPMLASAGSAAANELVAKPEAIAAFVSQIETDRPRGMAGIVWFRLPTTDDARAWSLPTWRAILARQPLSAGMEVLAQADANQANAALRNVILVNSGNTDAALPWSIRLDKACRSGDGINGYALETDSQGQYLRRTQDGLLRAGRQRNIGWLVCSQEKITFHVQL
jgi:hypothetical protein